MPVLVPVGSQNRDKRFLRDVDLAKLFHLGLALFLLFQQLVLAGHVAAIEFCSDVLSVRLDR